MRTYFKSVIHGHVQSVYNLLSTINTAYGHTPAWKDIFCQFHSSYLCYSWFVNFLYACMTVCMYTKQKDIGYKKVEAHIEPATKISDIN